MRISPCRKTIPNSFTGSYAEVCDISYIFIFRRHFFYMYHFTDDLNKCLLHFSYKLKDYLLLILFSMNLSMLKAVLENVIVFQNAFSSNKLLFTPCSRPKRPFTQTENSRHEKQAQKYQHRNKREGKWHKYGRTNGRHMANLEIELGQLPFDPKY